MNVRSGSGQASRIAAEARRRAAGSRDDPEERYRLAESFYLGRPGNGIEAFGRSELAFMRWEIDRGVLNPPHDRARPGSPWWRAVNERIVRDALEAGLLSDAGVLGGSSPAVDRWVEFLAYPSAAAWYRAHNASVVGGYIDARTLATRERPSEQFLMNLVLARVLFAQALAEEAPFAVDGHPLIASFISDPRTSTVGMVMDVPTFYPRTYPLHDLEEEVLERRAHSHGDDALAAIDSNPCAHVEELFTYAASSLDIPDMLRFHDRGLVCYPYGLLHDLDPSGERIRLVWLTREVERGSGRWTDEHLERMRSETDPEADEVVARYFEESSPLEARHFFAQLVLHSDLPPAECSPAVSEYLAARPPLPRWADPELMAQGEAFFSQWGLYVPLVLICSSLPECYAARKGVQVLHLTSRLATDARRRIVETAQMVLDVMSPGGMQVGAAGYMTVRRVRLMHAGIRYLIMNDPRIVRTPGPTSGPRWSEEWGMPVNQEDMAGTLTTFSWSVLTGLGSLGVPVSPQEAEAYLHSWNVVGAMLGIRDDMIPIDCDDAEALAEKIRARHWAESAEGREMTRALVSMLDESTPGRLVPGFSGTMIRHFVGDELADTLGVPAPSRARGLVRRMSTVAVTAGIASDQSWIVREVAGRVSRALLRSYARFDRGGTRPRFDIPTQLGATRRIRLRGPAR